MYLRDIFIYERPKPIHANKVVVHDSYSKEKIRYITRTVKNNGIKGYIDIIDDVKPNKGSCITVPMNGEGLLTPFVQTESFYAANLVSILRPKEKMSEEKMAWIATLIKYHRIRFSSHGREVNEERLMSLSVPDLKIPEINKTKYKKNLAGFSVEEKNIFEKATQDTQTFNLLDIFIRIGNGSAKINALNTGKIPLISATEKPGGITKYVSSNYKYEDSFTISNNGSIGYLNYIEGPFVATPDITILKLRKNIGKPNKLLIVWLKTFIELNRSKFNYGRKLKTRLNEISLPMPISKDQKIIWSIFDKNQTT